jgi:hypothetical protein
LLLAACLDETMTIRPIDNSALSDPTRQTTQVAPATPAGKTFETVLAQKKAASAVTPASQKIDVPEGETWAPIAGRDNAARITSGPRAGQYINLSHGDRRGQTFKVETRDGQQVHVYGSGDSELAVGTKKDADDGARKINGKNYDNGVKIPKGEQWAPVEGHDNYADILSGKRNGFYVNISGGVRDGMAFQIVKRGDKTFHVYGSGKHKQEIEVGVNKKSDSTATTPTGTTSTTGSTGGTTATGTSQTGPSGA